MVCCCCQPPKEGGPPSSAATFDRPKDETEQINAELRRIRDHIVQLQEQCFFLLRRQNSVQSSTRALPLEILSLIFQYACPSPNYCKEWDPPNRLPWRGYYTFHLTLASVSAQWRQVVLSTPQLWSSVEGLFLRGSTMGEQDEIFNTWFKRSGNVDLQLAIGHDFMADVESNTFLSPEVDTSLLENRHRIRSFRLETCNTQGWVPILSQFTQLTSLTIMPELPARTTEFNLSLPINTPLTNFCLYSPFIRVRLELPWAKITAVTLSELGIDLCLELCLNCPNLVEFWCFELTSPKEPPAALRLTRTTEIANLEALAWTFVLPEIFLFWNTAFCKYIRVPKLKTLQWVEGDTKVWDPRHAINFINDLPMSITNLQFVDVRNPLGFFSGKLLPFIRRNSRVESIVLKICDNGFVKDILRVLLVDASNGTIVFPDLKEIHIDGRHTNLSDATLLDLETGELVTDVLKDRWNKGYIKRFTLVVGGFKSVPLGPSVVQDLNSLFDDGLDLTVKVAGTTLVPSYSGAPD